MARWHRSVRSLALLASVTFGAVAAIALLPVDAELRGQ